MSYINDALHKVQNDKEAPYASRAPAVAAKTKKSRSWGKPLFAGALIALLGVAGGLALWGSVRPEAPAPGPAVNAPRPAAALPAAAGEAPAPPAAGSAAVKPALPAAPAAKEDAAAPAGDGVPAVRPAAPDDAKRLYTLALQKQREGRLREAARLYGRVLAREPRHVQALNNLGVVYLNLKQYRRARIRLNDALQIRPDYADAHYNLACLYAQKNDTKQSLFYLKNAVDYNPDVRQWAAADKDLRKIAHLPEFSSILQTRDQ